MVSGCFWYLYTYIMGFIHQLIWAQGAPVGPAGRGDGGGFSHDRQPASGRFQF